MNLGHVIFIWVGFPKFYPGAQGSLAQLNAVTGRGTRKDHFSQEQQLLEETIKVQAGWDVI